MKKTIALLLSILSILLFAGCSSEVNSSDAGEPAKEMTLEEKLCAHRWYYEGYYDEDVYYDFEPDGTYTRRTATANDPGSNKKWEYNTYSGTWEIRGSAPAILSFGGGNFNRNYAEYTNEEIESGRAVFPQGQWTVTDKFFEIDGTIYTTRD